MRRLLPLLAAAAVVAAVVIGLTQSGGEDSGAQDRAGTFDLNAAKERLRGAPAPLAALHDQSSRLLEGGKRAFADRLAELEGHPVVVNKWASWCGPCRFEFPVFQRVATARGREVAFVGLDARDNRDEAAEFLSEFPVPFPSYVDPEEEIARDIGAPANYPITLFYDRRGRRAFVHQGPYRSDADLSADIDRYTG